jgi:hypothetical protein
VVTFCHQTGKIGIIKMTNRHFQSQFSFGIRFALIAVNDGSKAYGKSRDVPSAESSEPKFKSE